MTRRIWLTMLLLVGTLNISSQVHRGYEYWLDMNYDSRQSGETDTANIAISIPLEGQEYGMHTLTLRFSEEGIWGAPSCNLFYIPVPNADDNKPVAYEYWLDDEYDSRTKQAFSEGSTIDLNVDLSELPTGVHFFSIRSRRADGVWGGLNRSMFYVADNKDEKGDFAQYEYWLDDDYEHKVEAESNGSAVIASIDLSELPTGVHFFSIRCKDSDGRYGGVNRSLFYVADNTDEKGDFAKYEYWLDDDYEGRVETEASGANISTSIDISKLTPGVHFFSIRCKDSDGRNGGVNRSLFYVPEPDDAPSPYGGYEFWLDDDFAHRVSSMSNNPNVSLKISLSKLEKGIHYFTFRTRNARKQWSAPVRSLFYYSGESIEGAENLVAYRYQFNNKTTVVQLPEEQQQATIEDMVIPFPEICDYAKTNLNCCSFAFDGDDITMYRNTQATFSIQFQNKLGDWTFPEFAPFEIADTLMHTAIPLKAESTMTFDKLRQGDYLVAKIVVAEDGYFYVRSSQEADFWLYRDGAIYNTISPSELKNCALLGLDAGTYYAVIANTVTDEANKASAISIAFSASEIVDDPTADDEEEQQPTDIEQYTDIIYADAIEAEVGSELEWSVMMKNEMEVKGFEFDLYLPDGVTVPEDEDGFPMVELSLERTTTKKTNTFDASFNEDGSLHVMCNSTRDYTFDGNEGEVCIVSLKVSTDVKAKKYPVLVKNVTLYGLTEEKHISLVTTTIAVKTTPVEMAFIDGTAYTSDEEQEASKLTYSRSFGNTHWQALYVPFAISTETLAENGLVVARINDVRQYDYEMDGTIDETAVEIFRLRNGSTKPNTAYMIRAKETGDKVITMNDATLYPAQENSHSVTSWDTEFTFVGTYHTITGQEMLDGEYYALGGGALHQTTSSANDLKPQRWYMTVTDRNGNKKNVNEVKVFLFGEEDQETGIVTLYAQPERSEGVYDLSGRKVSGTQKGVYIKNGKKVIRK